MNCAGCSAPCCRDVLYLTPREFERLRKKNPSLKYAHIGDIFILTPCPFLVENQCTIYTNRPLACVRYPLNVQFRENSVLLILHFKCPQVPKPHDGDQVVSIPELERMGIYLTEYHQMLVANLILDAEMGYAWKNFTLKERNKMRIFEAKTKQPNSSGDAIIVAISLEAYSDLVQIVEDFLLKNPNCSISQVSKMVSKILPGLNPAS
jgi:Fe-S-cluster containining protein